MPGITQVRNIGLLRETSRYKCYAGFSPPTSPPSPPALQRQLGLHYPVSHLNPLPRCPTSPHAPCHPQATEKNEKDQSKKKKPKRTHRPQGMPTLTCPVHPARRFRAQVWYKLFQNGTLTQDELWEKIHQDQHTWHAEKQDAEQRVWAQRELRDLAYSIHFGSTLDSDDSLLRKPAHDSPLRKPFPLGQPSSCSD